MSYDYADSEVDASVIADLRKRVAELEAALCQAAQGREALEAAKEFADDEFSDAVDLNRKNRISRLCDKIDDALALTPAVAPDGARETLDLRSHLQRQRNWSGKTFGPGSRAQGVVDHIRKELREIEADPTDLAEWIDVVILALDGAWRSGATPDEIIAALVAKQTKNENREWPDWRTADPDKAIEHVKSATLAQAQEPGEDYTAWLVELNDQEGPLYFRLTHDDEDWTKNHDDALHLSRREDAQQIIGYYGWTRAKAIEHCWPALTQRAQERKA